MSVTFAERLRELRHKAGLTQEALADAAGVPLPSLRGYEQGTREPFWHVLLRLARGLGVPAEAFGDCTSKDERPGRGQGATPRRRASRPGKGK
jgi:transcriptional regulator with XRE-family HTH domain